MCACEWEKAEARGIERVQTKTVGVTPTNRALSYIYYRGTP